MQERALMLARAIQIGLPVLTWIAGTVNRVVGSKIGSPEMEVLGESVQLAGIALFFLSYNTILS